MQKSKIHKRAERLKKLEHRMEKLKDDKDKSHKVSIHKVQCSTNWGSRNRTEKIQKSQYFFLNEENIERYSHHIEKATEYYHYLT